MELYPDNLGEWVSREVQQERDPMFPQVGRGVKPKFVGAWALGCLALTGIFWALQSFVMVFSMAAATAGLFTWYCALTLEARGADAGRQKPVSAYEIQSVRQQAQDALMQHYLDLVRSVLNLPATKDAAADREVREAVTALAVALEALPPDPKVTADDPAALRADAEMQALKAQAEGDAVIAASLNRRAESLRRRADTAARTLLLLRRNGALREEVGEQIRALQTSLTALQVGGRQSTPELSGLAASIHRVALEANAVTIARVEVDALLSRPGAQEEETRQRLGSDREAL